MNNLPKVVTQQRRGRASNPRIPSGICVCVCVCVCLVCLTNVYVFVRCRGSQVINKIKFKEGIKQVCFLSCVTSY